MHRIQKAVKAGHHDCCFDASVYYYKPTGKVYGVYFGTFNTAEWDVYHYSFSDYKDEVKNKFEQAGYKIKPTGYIGGVWQLTEDIVW